MNIVYAAEKDSIANLLSEYTHLDVPPEAIAVSENPDETGSFFVGWEMRRYLLTPGGRIASIKSRRD